MKRLLLAVALSLLALCDNAQAQAYKPISDWPIPTIGNVNISTGDRGVFTRSGVSYGLTAGWGGTCSTNQWVNLINPQGVPSCAQPSFSNISGFVSSGQLGGYYTFSGLQLSANSASLPTKQTGTLLQIGNANGTASRYEADSFAAPAYYTIIREDGTAASPTTLQSGDEIGGYNAWGYNGTAITGPRASFRMFAAQNWTTTANGTYSDITTTPIGTTATGVVIHFDSTGNVGIGTTMPVQKLQVIGTALISSALGIGTTAPNGPLTVVGLGTSAPVGTTSAAYLCIDSANNVYRKATCP